MESIAKKIISIKFVSRQYFAIMEDGETAEITRKQYFFIISKSADGHNLFYDGTNVATQQETAVTA